jgi:Kef-type K+ transport system membrane component KefB
MRAFGALGVSLVTLSILGYASINILILGFLLVLVDTYIAYTYHRDLQISKDALLTIVGLLWYSDNSNEEIDEED